jgi:hypothetical protein
VESEPFRFSLRVMLLAVVPSIVIAGVALWPSDATHRFLSPMARLFVLVLLVEAWGAAVIFKRARRPWR